jgi:hypothetical protein
MTTFSERKTEVKTEVTHSTFKNPQEIRNIVYTERNPLPFFGLFMQTQIDRIQGISSCRVNSGQFAGAFHNLPGIRDKRGRYRSSTPTSSRRDGAKRTFPPVLRVFRGTSRSAALCPIVVFSNLESSSGCPDEDSAAVDLPSQQCQFF